MKRIIPNIMVSDCKEALEFYRDVFRGDINNVQTAEGKEMFKGYENKIIHSELQINANCIMYFGDILEGHPVPGGNIGLILELESEEEINQLYNSLSREGSVRYELQKTFWGAFHAVVTDKYGVTWNLNF